MTPQEERQGKDERGVKGGCRGRRWRIRGRFLSVEKAESRRFEVVKVDFNFEAVLKVLRANADPCSRL